MAINAKVITPDRLAKFGLLAAPIDTSSQGIEEAALKHAHVVTGQDIYSLHLSQRGKWPLAEGMNSLVATAVAAWGRSNKGLLDGNILSMYILLRDPSIYAANTIGVFEEMIDYLVNKPGVIEWVQKHAADYSSPQVKERLDQLSAMIAAAVADGDLESLYSAYPGLRIFINKRPESLCKGLETLIAILSASPQQHSADRNPR